MSDDRRRLWKTTFSADAYRDQFGRAGHGYRVTSEVDVTVVERKPAIGMWSRKPHENMALRAVDADGREYFCNWDGSFADDSPTPMWIWAGGWEAANIVAIFPSVYPDGRIANPKPDTPGLKAVVSVDKASGPDQVATVAYWGGRPLTELTREELIEALNALAQTIEDLRAQNDRERRMLVGLARRQ